MLNRIFRPIPAIALSALIAGAITILPGASDTVIASAPFNGGKTDRIDMRPMAPQCAQQAWPHIEARCLRDTRVGVGQVKAVRVVSTDRIGADASATRTMR